MYTWVLIQLQILKEMKKKMFLPIRSGNTWGNEWQRAVWNAVLDCLIWTKVVSAGFSVWPLILSNTLLLSTIWTRRKQKPNIQLTTAWQSGPFTTSLIKKVINVPNPPLPHWTSWVEHSGRQKRQKLLTGVMLVPGVEGVAALKNAFRSQAGVSPDSGHTVKKNLIIS